MEPTPSPAPPAPKKSRFSRLEQIALIAGPPVFLGLILYFTLFRTYYIPSGSMEPTLLVGDSLVVRMWRFERPEPRRGDIVVFQSPEDPRIQMINRVVGLPGDKIAIIDKNLQVNGQMVEEPYVVHRDMTPEGFLPDAELEKRDNFGPEVVPADHFFIMGDNRDNSYDSRFYGPVPRDHLRGGGSIWVYWSKGSREVRWDRIGQRLR